MGRFAWLGENMMQGCYMTLTRAPALGIQGNTQPGLCPAAADSCIPENMYWRNIGVGMLTARMPIGAPCWAVSSKCQGSEPAFHQLLKLNPVSQVATNLDDG